MRQLFGLTIGLAAFTIASGVFAQGGGGKGMGQKGVCRSEVQELCGSFRGQPDQMKACVTEHMQEFSEICQARLANKDWSQRGPKRGARGQGRGMCRQEVDQHCGNFRGQFAEMQACLKDNMSKFSEFCQGKIQKRWSRDGATTSP